MSKRYVPYSSVLYVFVCTYDISNVFSPSILLEIGPMQDNIISFVNYLGNVHFCKNYIILNLEKIYFRSVTI